MLEILSDGKFHSGQQLGRHLGISRAAVWKQIKQVADLGISVHSVSGKGYRLSDSLELLRHQAIDAELDAPTRARIGAIHILPQVDSTNSYLKRQLHEEPASGTVCLAEWQSAGRGRRGRQWHSPFGRNLYLSMLWRFPCGPAAMNGLSLAMGIAVVRSLEDVGLRGAGLKWPNDILVGTDKLGGILVDMSGETGGPTSVVIGIGINVGMPTAAAAHIDQSWTDLHRHLDAPVSRNTLAAKLLCRIVGAAECYERDGLTGFHEDWRRYDLTRDRIIGLDTPQGHVAGRARGIDESGALLVECDGSLRPFSSGEISLRIQK